MIKKRKSFFRRCTQGFSKALLWLFFGLFSAMSVAEVDFLRLLRLSPDEGLSEGYVNNLLIDADGFLWLATEGGLNRYDGYDITEVKGPDGVFSGTRLPYLFQDSTGLMWISHANTGLYTLDLNTRQYTKRLEEKVLAEPSDVIQVDHIVEQENGNLWLASTQNLRLFNRATGRIEVVFSISEMGTELDAIRRLLVHEEHLYIAAVSGLYVLNINTRQYKYIQHTPFDRPREEQLNSKELYMLGDTLFVGTVEGLYSIEVGNIQAVIDGIESQATPVERIRYRNIWRLLHHNGIFYVATDEGLYTYDYNLDIPEKLFEFANDRKFEITDNNVRDMVIDAQGNFWLASRMDGAFYWNPKTSAFRAIYRKKFGVNQLSDNLVWSVKQTRDGEFWAGSQNGLNKIDLKNGAVESFMISDDKKAVSTIGTIYNIMEGQNDLLWLVTGDFDNRIVAFDRKEKKRKAILLASKEAQDIMAKPSAGHYLDEQGNMWFFNEESFYRYDTNKGTVSELTGLKAVLKPGMTASFLGILPNHPDSIMVSVFGQLWLYDIERNQARKIYDIPNFQPQDYLAPESWVVDKYNTLWLVISQFGLVGLDADTFEVKHVYDQTNKLPNNTIYGALLDKKGDIWMSSHQGIFRMDGVSHHIEHFTIKDGLATNEFNGGVGITSHAKLQSGALAYGSMLGVTLFDPDSLVRDEQKSQSDVKITSLSLLSRELQMPIKDLSGTELELNYDDIGLQINFSTLNFMGKNKTRYRFELTGKKTIEYPESTEHSILFPQLQPGKYTFNVIAIEPQSGVESDVKSVHISVAYAWYASPAAYSVYSLMIVAMLFYWYRRRQRHEQRLLKAHKNVLVSEERLRLALRGSGSGVWDWQADKNVLFEPRVGELLQHISLPKFLSFVQHVDLIHPNDQCEFESAWAMFLASPDNNFECTYRMKDSEGHWYWFRDLGMVAERNEYGKPTRVTGTYTNITETKANEEQARLFGEAFKQTRDWVVILDVYQEPIAANQSFRETFGLSQTQVLPQNAGEIVGIDRKQQVKYAEILNGLEAGAHWQGEEIVLNREGQAYPVILSINAVAGKGDEVAFFVLVLTDITAQKAAENDLRQLANYDSLTGLPNRALLLDRIKHAIEHARRYKFNMALFFIDLDRFKQVNDSLGHDVGDKLLIDVSQRLTAVLREGDTVARLGGDEFVILLESFRTLEDVSHVAQKVIDEIDQPITLGKHVVSVSPSIGIALYPDDATHHNDLLKNADVAMYHAKEAGRNNFQFFTVEMNERARVKLEEENAIKQGFLNDEFVNFYQPLVDAKNHCIKGFELLLRWQSAEGLVPPYKFIPVAEDIGLIVKMTQAALKRGLTDLKRWQEEGFQPYLSVNLSIKDLEQDSLADDVEAAIKQSGLPASSIRFEITESALMIDINKAIETMNRLTRLGCVLALDDFGTGYSSLKYLKEFPIDIIKIDRGFVKDIGIDKNDEAIIDSILAMADSLGKYCVAEGVETTEQLAYLTERNCALIQGYLYSPPVPFEEATALLNKTFEVEVV